jgi:hypothetical protein
MAKTSSEPQAVSARDWLRQNNYEDVAGKIDSVMSRWAKQGKATRRNWWDVLAGRLDGRPKKIEGITFPVLRTARVRKGWDVPSGCLCRNDDEQAPPAAQQARWLNRPENRRHHEEETHES